MAGGIGGDLRVPDPTVSPLSGEYEPGEPEFGFLYPAFKERGAAMNLVNIFEKNPARVHRELGAWMLQG